MVATTARQHVTGFAALNIPHARRLGGDWHDAWFDVKSTRVSPHHVTDEQRFGRLLDRSAAAACATLRPGLALLGHPAAASPEKVWAATHERAVVEMAWARLDGMTAEDLAGGAAAGGPRQLRAGPAVPGPMGAGPLVGVAPAGVLTPMERAAWDTWQREWSP